MPVTRQVTTFIDFAGRRKDGHMVRSIVPQFDGSTYAAGNCAAASEASRDIVEKANGKIPGTPWPPTGASIRKGTGDTVGGLMPSQTARVSRERYGIGSDIRIVDWTTVIEKLWAGYGVTLLVWYGPIADAGHSGSPGFRENHSIRLLGIRLWSTGEIEILVGDPLCDGRRAGIPEGTYWLKLSVLKRASADLVVDHGDTIIEKYGSNKAFVSFNVTPKRIQVEPSDVVLKYGAHKVRPKRLRCKYDRTIVRTSPKRIAGNHARVIDKGDTFDAYQRVKNAYGVWVGNKAGTRWVKRAGFSFVRYLP